MAERGAVAAASQRLATRNARESWSSMMLKTHPSCLAQEQKRSKMAIACQRSCIYGMVWLSWLGTVLMSVAYGGLALNILTGTAEASNAHRLATALPHCSPAAASAQIDAPLPLFPPCWTQWAANSSLDQVMDMSRDLIGVVGTTAILVFTLAFFILFSMFALCM